MNEKITLIELLLYIPGAKELTHLPLVPHMYASVIIGSGNGLSPVWCQAITGTNAGLLSTGLLGTSFSEIRNGILLFSFKKMHLKMSSVIMAAILSSWGWVKCESLWWVGPCCFMIPLGPFWCGMWGNVNIDPMESHHAGIQSIPIIAWSKWSSIVEWWSCCKIDQLTRSTNSTMQLFHIPQCSIQNGNVHISILNGAWWDIEQVHFGICEIGLLVIIASGDWWSLMKIDDW